MLALYVHDVPRQFRIPVLLQQTRNDTMDEECVHMLAVDFAVLGIILCRA